MLVVVLAGVDLHAAPLTPTADNDAIHAEIVAADPKLTSPPAPLERLLVATDLAEQKLRQATDMDDADDLLTLTAHGRRVAYRRTNDALHLCRLISAADSVLARDLVTPSLSASATDFREEALGALGSRSCENQPPRERAASTLPVGDKVKPAGVVESSPRPADHTVMQSTRPADHRHLRAGLGTLIPGLVLFAPMAGLLAYGIETRRDMAALNAATATRPATDAENRQAATLNDRFTGTTAAAAALGVTAGALVVTGAVLLAVKRRPTRAALAPWGGRGVGGLVVQGRF